MCNDLDFDLDDIDIGPDTRGVLKKIIKKETAVHNNGALNRLVVKKTPTLSEHGILIATNHRRTGKNIIALDMDKAATFPNFDDVFNKEMNNLIKTFKKKNLTGGW
jgi:hypothetical protein